MNDQMVEYVQIDSDEAMQDACHKPRCDQPAEFFFKAGVEHLHLCDAHARVVKEELSSAFFQKRAQRHATQGAPSGLVRRSG